jgi:16S rRNA processing protein RimM
MKEERYFVVGEIVNTQGIKGEVRVIPHTDDITRFELLDEILVEKKGKLEKYAIEGVRYHKQFVLLKFKGVDDMTTAEKLKTCMLKIPESQALPLEEGEYYIRDLYDLKVIDEDGAEIGILHDILFTGANDVYIVRPKTGKDIYLPAIKSCVLNVNLDEGTMTVHIPEGLL